MTTSALVAAVRRRWYVCAAVLVLTAVVVIVLGSARQVYWSRADVVFLPPDNPTRAGNALEGSDESLVFFAAAIEREFNGDDRPIPLASPDATLYGAGVLRGFSVTLPNAGGQWQTNFNEPVLRIQVVDSTGGRARVQMSDVVQRLERLVRDRQARSGVTDSGQIRLKLSPDQPQVTFVSGSTRRALAGIGLLGLGLAVAAALGVDRWRSRGATAVAARRGATTEPASAALLDSSRSQRAP